MKPICYKNENGSEVITTAKLLTTAYFSDPEGVIYSLYPSGHCNYIGTIHVNVETKTVMAIGQANEVSAKNHSLFEAERPVLWESDLNFTLMIWTEIGHINYEESAKLLQSIRVWLDRQDETITKGLRSLEDAVKLYKAYHEAKPSELVHVDLPIFADTYDFIVDTSKGPAYETVESIHKVILGYSPLESQDN